MRNLLPLMALLAGLSSGCHPAAPEAKPAPLSTGTIARIHWLGKDRISTATNSAAFMGIWALPQTAALQAQTLDKLAAAPWRVPQASLNTNELSTNLLSALSGTNFGLAVQLRALLEDVLQQECYLEVREPATNQPPELVFAIQLNDQSAARWATNLPAILQSIAQAPSAGSGTNLETAPIFPLWQGTAAPPRLQSSRVRGWSLFGLAPAQNALLAELEARTRTNGSPSTTTAVQPWFQVEADLPRLAHAFGLDPQLTASLSTLSFRMVGDLEGVHTTGELNFSKPLALQLETWRIPTNLIREKLIGFTVVRGFKPFTASVKPLTNLPAVASLNQLVAWDRNWNPFEMYCALPTAQASNCVEQIASALLTQANPWITNNSLGDLSWTTNFYGLIWDKAPYMRPFIRQIQSDGTDFVGAGFSPYYITNMPSPSELLRAATANPTLVYYDWELTGPRIEAWFHVGQLLRVLLLRPQLPSESVGALWLNSLEKRLGNGVTALTWTAPNQLSLTRHSAIGLTGFELHLLVDWLESSRFPAGLHTLDGPNRPPLRHRLLGNHRPAGTNRPPVQFLTPK